MKLTYTILLIISLCTAAYTQDTIPKSKTENRAFKHALGLFGSIDSGLGISYRYSPNNFRFQVTTLPMYVNLLEVKLYPNPGKDGGMGHL